jgi:hypothetical protein
MLPGLVAVKAENKSKTIHGCQFQVLCCASGKLLGQACCLRQGCVGRPLSEPEHAAKIEQILPVRPAPPNVSPSREQILAIKISTTTPVLH